MQIFFPDLWDRIFTPGYVPPEETETIEDDVLFAATDEEFEALMEQIDQEEEEARRQGRAGPTDGSPTPTVRSWTPEPPVVPGPAPWPPPEWNVSE